MPWTGGRPTGLLPPGSGDGALLYLWLLGHGGELVPSAARAALKWDEVRLNEAAGRPEDPGSLRRAA